MHSVSASFLLSEPYNTIKDAVEKGDDYYVQARKIAKGCSFLVQYGGSAKALSKNLNITMEEAKRFIDNYYHTYKQVGEWQAEVFRSVQLNQTLVEGEQVGYYTSPFNTKYAFTKKSPPWDSSVKNFVPTEVKNYPIQGTASDIVKVAMALMTGVLYDMFGGRVLLINSIHDSFIFDLDMDSLTTDDLELLGFTLEYICCTQVEETLIGIHGCDPLPVKLDIDIEIGDSWDDMSSFDSWLHANR